MSNPQGADDGLDDPYQCAFCGRPTLPADRRCPHCRRSLLVAEHRSLAVGGSLRTAIFLLSILAVTSLLEIGPPVFARLVAQGADPHPYRVLLLTPGAALLLGPFLDWTGRVATILLAVAAARTAILAACVGGLHLRWPPGYLLTVGALVLDLLWTLYRVAASYVGPGGAVGIAALDFAILPLLFAADRDFAVVQQRLLVRPDGGLRSALDYHRRGHAYRRQGMWAMAVAHWRLAVGAAPRQVQYYKDLGVGYAQIGQYERSLQCLAEAGRQDPEDGEVGRMIELVRERQASIERKA
jgi:hypothetical protein